MYTINKNLQDITEADIQRLVDETVIENKTLEYKSELPDNTDDKKKKFLATVSSFANASGGDLIFGVAEDRKTGKPNALTGIEIENVDQEILRLEHMIRDGIEPNISSSSLNTYPILLSNSNYVLIMRIGKSWVSPHRVSYKKWNQFYTRSTNGKYQPDIQELKTAFLLSETVGEKIKQFRERRISDIYANELPIPFYSSPKIVLHIIPFISFEIGQIIDVKKLSLYDIQPMGSSSFNKRYNIDGLLTYSSFKNKKRSYSYVQLFRNGIIEAVNTEILWFGDGDKIIPIKLIEEELIEKIPTYIGVYNKLGIDVPILLFLTFVDVKDYKFPLGRPFWSKNAYPIDRNIILIPEIIIKEYKFDPTQLLRPVFDSIWNACGYERSFNYNKEGVWEPRF